MNRGLRSYSQSSLSSSLVSDGKDKSDKAAKSSPRTKNLTTNDDLATLIAELKADIENKFDNLYRAIQMEISDKLRSLKEEIGAKFDSQISSIEATLAVAQNRISDLTEDINKNAVMYAESEERVDFLQKSIYRLENNHEETARQLLLTDVIISGVPEHKNENLIELFNRIAAIVGYNAPLLPQIFRAKDSRSSRQQTNGAQNHGPSTSNSRPAHASGLRHRSIIVKFPTPSLRKEFVLKCASTRGIKLSSIGFTSDLLIFIYDSLTKNARELKAAALDLRRRKKLHSVFTMDGFVYIKRNENSRRVKITSKSDLNNICLGSGSDIL